MAGSPIRTSADHRLFAPSRGFSQLVASFFASGSHRHPPCALLHFLVLFLFSCVFLLTNYVYDLFRALPLSDRTLLSKRPDYDMTDGQRRLKVGCFERFSRKEVFQPHLPVRLPCYDLAPVTRFTLGRSSRSRTSGTPNFHGLTGGVYKARERIHRAMADARLLANPTSRSRVADSDPN